MAGRDLCETSLVRQGGQSLFVRWVFPGVHQNDGASSNSFTVRLLECETGSVLLKFFDSHAVYIYATADFDHLFVKHLGQPDRQIEQTRARLVADPQQV